MLSGLRLPEQQLRRSSLDIMLPCERCRGLQRTLEPSRTIFAEGRSVIRRPAGMLQDTAHAAASVHATVMSEEDAMSEGETHLSSRRAGASRSVANLRSAAAPGAYIEERQASHHTAGLTPC